ncbi:MAG: ATP-binding protein [Elusimicrobiaceae bacterium]|nr:ATP-binding protein [Elusimicrobiaceae bacterium]
MITEWDIVSNLDPSSSSIQYTLLIDGTEQDARLIAKKLEGYVQAPQPALAPFVYRFDLPADLDEDTLEKLRVAVREGIEQAKKVNEFVPGGSLGNPLFNAEATQEDKNFPTFITLDPSESFFEAKQTNTMDIPLPQEAESVTEPEAEAETEAEAEALPAQEEDLPSPEKMDVQVQSVQAEELSDQFVAENAQVPSDLPKPEPEPVKEAEASAPDAQQPLDDILLAETKYDMFVDLEQLDKQAAAKKASSQEKAPADTQEDAFNIFDQKIKDQTAFIDLADITGITERITQKDLEFVKHATVPPSPAPSVPTPDAPTEDTEEVLDPFEQLLAAASAPKQPEPTAEQPETPQTIEPQEPQSDPKPAAVVPAPAMEEKMNTENPGEKKTFIHLKHKAPEAPKPPTPPKPEAPAAPAAPAPKAPAAPAPKAPIAPAPTSHMRPAKRRSAPAATFLEKTHTIDHSIQIPLTELNQSNWSLEVPLVPTYTLENMTISINRFAHATAISVIDNPGKMYNPLVLHGASGTGKTHFLHAIGYALSKKLGQENVFITNGVRLSRGIQRYISEGNLQEFEDFTSKMKALLIDDIHLISVNEQNRAHLSKLLHDFRAQNKQIVITSKYPPENLAKLEELLDFKLDSGWISELKQASGPARSRIIQKMLVNNGINISNDDANRFFGHPNISLGAVSRSIRRVRVLEKLIFPDQEPSAQSALSIFDQLLATKGEDQTSLISQKSVNDIHSISVTGKGEWGRIGFFYPQNSSNMMNWLVFALQQRAKELGIPGGPELAVRSSYTTDNIISSAFKIANLCDNKKLKGAVILGPHTDLCEPSVRDNFYDILTHMLEIMLIRCGVLNTEDAAAPSTYVKILAELLR